MIPPQVDECNYADEDNLLPDGQPLASEAMSHPMQEEIALDEDVERLCEALC
jgi:hypothetical protein